MAVILYFPEYQKQAQLLAEALSLPCYLIDVHHFPDTESRITLPDISATHAIIYCGLEYPNNKLIELMLAVKTLQKKGYKRISLIAPYLCYMRQDMAFHKGEAVSQDIIGNYLTDLIDDVITVDPHLHRTNSLQKVFPHTNTYHISATDLFSPLVNEITTETVLLGPDEESGQWVKRIADINNLPYTVAQKVRHGDKNVSIILPEYDFTNKSVVIVDDVISSGGTILNISKLLTKKDVGNIYVFVTHALFDNNTYNKLKQAGIKEIFSSDSIPHKTNKVSIVPLLAEQVKNWID